jgi:hypothetical protein
MEPDLRVVILGRPPGVRVSDFLAFLEPDDPAPGRPQAAACRETADETAHPRGKQARAGQEEGHHHQAGDEAH